MCVNVHLERAHSLISDGAPSHWQHLRRSDGFLDKEHLEGESCPEKYLRILIYSI